MKKLNFDGRLLEGKDIRKKLRDIVYEADFSGNEFDETFLSSLPSKKYFHKKNLFYLY